MTCQAYETDGEGRASTQRCWRETRSETTQLSRLGARTRIGVFVLQGSRLCGAPPKTHVVCPNGREK